MEDDALVLGSTYPIFTLPPELEKKALSRGRTVKQAKDFVYLNLKSRKLERVEVSYLDRDGVEIMHEVYPWELLK